MLSRPKVSRTTKTLNLQQRMDVIRDSDLGASSRVLAAKFQVGRTQILNVLRRRAEVIAEFEAGSPLTKRRLKTRSTGNEIINQLCHKWYLDALTKRISLTGVMLREKALKFACDLSITSFVGSNGWLDCFIKRHSISLGKISEDSKNGCQDECDQWNWTERLKTITAGYEARDIFNLAEYGLFFKLSEDKSFYLKGDRCSEGNKSKERVTICLCVNMLGEKEEVLVIGKPVRPSAFGSLDLRKLPVSYKNSEKAWMTPEIFNAWLMAFNGSMHCQNRHVLLFLDRLPSHPKLHLSNVKLVFFPPNTTHQPLDQGIIQDLKSGYRKAQHHFIMSEMRAASAITIQEIMASMSLLDTLYWIVSAWKAVEAKTIRKCFSNAGFSNGEVKDEIVDPTRTEEMKRNLGDPLSADLDKLSQELVGLPFNRLLEIDDDLATCDTQTIDWSRPAPELIALFNGEVKAEEENEEDLFGGGNELEYPETAVTELEAFAMLKGLRTYLHQQGLIDAVESLGKVGQEMLKSASDNETGVLSLVSH